jgi:deoxycytidylate deaminase
MGAAAVYRGSLLAIGWNSEKTHPLQARYNRLREFDGYHFQSKLHAEMMVVTKIAHLDIDFSQVDIYIWRGDDVPQLSRPCAACEAALRELGIKRVFYTGNNSYIKEIYD